MVAHKSKFLQFIVVCILHNCILVEICSAQKEWSYPPPLNDIKVPSEYTTEDVIILDDKIFLDLRHASSKTLYRDIILKINTKEGLHKFQSVTLPESFDRAWNMEFWQQGRVSKIDIPFLQEFNVNYFDIRIVKPNNTIQYLKPKLKYHKVRWIKANGEYSDDDLPAYSFSDIEVGDVVEYKYAMDYQPKYGSDMFYLASEFPKLKLTCTFEYFVLPQVSNYNFILAPNIPESQLQVTKYTDENGMVYVDNAITLENIDKVNFPIHAMSAASLPYAYFNMNYTIRLFNSRLYSFANLPDYRWASEPQPNTSEFDWYTKYPNDIRNFVNSFPKFEKDSSNIQFIKALIDTFNCFRYYSTNYLYYNNPRLYSVFSSQHLLKRRLVESNILHLYKSILNDKGVFYYLTNVQDKRLGENNPLIRNRSYENIILSVPYHHSYFFIVPRYNGLSYFLNELPFYYQGALAALFPVNYVKLPGDTMGNHFRFIKTHAGSCDENLRIESCNLRINLDSTDFAVSGNLALLGQFSTILRPYYLGNLIDSTINEFYFRKFLRKPGINRPTYSLKSKSELFPYKHVFNGEASISNVNQGAIDLHHWFSFLLSSKLIPEKPSHDYFFDFPFSDIYTFNFLFNNPVTILNPEHFDKIINNDYFELNSSMTVSDKKLQWQVIVKVKKLFIPKSDAALLMEFVTALDELNSKTIQYKK